MKTKLVIALLFLVIMLFCVSSLLSISSYRVPIWDESVYLSMGKFIYSDGHLGLWEPLRPVGLPLLLGILWLFKADYLWLSQAFMVFLSALLVLFTYLLAKKVTQREGIALAAAILLAATPVFFSNSARVMTEVPSVLLALIALCLFADKMYAAGGALAAAAFLTKFPQGLILGAMLLFVFWKTIKSRKWSVLGKGMVVCLAFLFVCLPYLVFNYLSFSSIMQSPARAALWPFITAAPHQFNPVEMVIQKGNIGSYVYNLFFYIVNGLKTNLLLIFSIIGIWAFARQDKAAASSDDKPGLVLVMLPLLLIFAYMTYIPNKQVRFLILMLPYLCILSAAGLLYVFDRIREKKIAKYFFIALVLLSFGFCLFQNVMISSQQRNVVKAPEIEALYGFFKERGISGKLLVADPVFGAYNDYSLVPFYFSPKEGLSIIEDWQKVRGYSAIVYSRQSYYCADDDEQCISALDQIESRIAEGNALVMNSTFYQGRRYLIYVPKITG